MWLVDDEVLQVELLELALFADYDLVACGNNIKLAVLQVAFSN
eukprot:SAG31_NODE_732_length_12494_cov_3.395482_1_plen_43_part_00